jgi:hypothetical protein
VTLGFLSSWCSFPLSFDFFKDADSHVVPYLDNAVDAGEETVSSRQTCNAPALTAKEALSLYPKMPLGYEAFSYISPGPRKRALVLPGSDDQLAPRVENFHRA